MFEAVLRWINRWIIVPMGVVSWTVFSIILYVWILGSFVAVAYIMWLVLR